jgi:hypothetical protein
MKELIKKNILKTLGVFLYIKKVIGLIPQDKKDHVLLGMFIGYPLQLIGYLMDITIGTDYLFILGSIIGITLVGLKEIIHDGWMGKGNVELLDFIASAIPIAATLITYFI